MQVIFLDKSSRFWQHFPVNTRILIPVMQPTVHVLRYAHTSGRATTLDFDISPVAMGHLVRGFQNNDSHCDSSGADWEKQMLCNVSLFSHSLTKFMIASTAACHLVFLSSRRVDCWSFLIVWVIIWYTEGSCDTDPSINHPSVNS